MSVVSEGEARYATEAVTETKRILCAGSYGEYAPEMIHHDDSYENSCVQWMNRDGAVMSTNLLLYALERSSDAGIARCK